MGVNKVIVEGNLGADALYTVTKTRMSMLKLSLAVNESWKDKQGNWQNKVSWVNATLFGKAADNPAYHSLTKGTRVIVEGKLETVSWTDKQGDQKSMVQIKAERIYDLSPKDQQQQQPRPRPAQRQNGSHQPLPEPVYDQDTFTENDVPF